LPAPAAGVAVARGRAAPSTASRAAVAAANIKVSFSGVVPVRTGTHRRCLKPQQIAPQIAMSMGPGLRRDDGKLCWW
jgi:hypothetical protein